MENIKLGTDGNLQVLGDAEINGGLTANTVSATNIYNKTEVDEKVNKKQDKLTAGSNITITNNVISAIGGTSGDGFVAKTGDTMTGDLNVEANVSIGSGNKFVSINGLAGKYAFAQGSGCTAFANYSHAEGIFTDAIGHASHAEGSSTIANGNWSHAEGSSTIANGNDSHTEGFSTQANGDNSHAEGAFTIANNLGEHANGIFNISISGTNQDISVLTADTKATLFSVGNGDLNNRKNAFEIKYNGDTYIPQGNVSIGSGNTFTGGATIRKYAFAQGSGCVAIGNNSHAEGMSTQANGDNSHAEGMGTQANGNNSHANGTYTIAGNENEFVVGRYNVSIKTPLPNANPLFVVGNGTDATNRYNAFEVFGNGNTHINGDAIVAKGLSAETISATTITSPSLDAKQDTLVSGTNIKTINGENLLGSGNIPVNVDTSGMVAKSGDTMTGDLFIVDSRLWIGGVGNMTSGGICSMVQGTGCVATGDYSSSTGYGLNASNMAEKAVGCFNASTHVSETELARLVNSDATLFSIGNGTDNNNRSSAFEVKWNGDVYIWKNGVAKKLQDLF